ncbi:MAG: class I SAM-dependent methyltransferase [Chthoniobacteraceae bacterium]
MTDWNDYSQTYDLMATLTPAYQDLITRFRNEISQWDICPGAKILEVGAGTGNFSLEAAEIWPAATVIHSEPSSAMQKRAIEKAKQNYLSNIQFVPAPAEELSFPENSLDAVVLVHVLYALPDPKAFIKKLRSWLREGGYIFACDAGRVMDVSDWRKYLRHETIKKQGYFNGLKTMWMTRDIFKANEKIAEAQQSGQYWTHSEDEFAEAFRSAEFAIRRQEIVYRGYSDLLIAQKSS